MARNKLEQFGVTEDQWRSAAEIDAALNEQMNQMVADAKAIAPVRSGDYAAGIKITKKAKRGEGVIAATDWKSHMVEFGTGAPGPTDAFAVMEKTARKYGGTLEGVDFAVKDDQ